MFSSQFRLPACTTANGCFKKVFASSSKPNSNCGWGQQAALDMEWAHAMAPLAKIVLVEAASSSFTNLFTAVDVATAQVTTGGGEGEVSMSWSGGEFSTESSNDSHFQNTNVVYFASSGDTGGVNGFSFRLALCGVSGRNYDSQEQHGGFHGRNLPERQWRRPQQVRNQAVVPEDCRY